MKKVWLPKTPSVPDAVEMNNIDSLVIIGANGSGKSRLGAWIDGLVIDGGISHRVSAQKNLHLEEFVYPKTTEQAFRGLIIGSEQADIEYQQKKFVKWNNSPTTNAPYDFPLALSWLFAEHNRSGTLFRAAFLANKKVVPAVEETVLEVCLSIWHEVLPHRRLVVSDNRITAEIPGGEPYSSNELSDGEKSVLYFIAHVLALPKNSIFIVDEPESHLNAAILTSLWNQLEYVRPDCVFVYITHDLSFAASRINAKKIWVRSYEGGEVWDWQEIAADSPFPETMVLQILGSRKPILFVEGETGSLDLEIHRILFPDRLVIPLGSCEIVKNATASLRSLPNLHHTNAYGIIDRDRRSEAELDSYKNIGVYNFDVAEVENLFLLPEVIKSVAQVLNLDAEECLRKVQGYIFDSFSKEIQFQIVERANFQIQQKLNGFSGVKARDTDLNKFSSSVKSYLDSINPGLIYHSCKVELTSILSSRDYSKLLRYYNRKSLPYQVSGCFSLAKNVYPNFVMKHLNSQNGKQLRDELRLHVSTFPV